MSRQCSPHDRLGTQHWPGHHPGDGAARGPCGGQGAHQKLFIGLEFGCRIARATLFAPQMQAVLIWYVVRTSNLSGATAMGRSITRVNNHVLLAKLARER